MIEESAQSEEDQDVRLQQQIELMTDSNIHLKDMSGFEFRDYR